MSGTPLLEIEDISIGFGSGPDVLRHTSLSVEQGQFVSVLGPSGCGKSTILNAVAGLLSTRSGSIAFCGNPVRSVNTSVGYMTQHDTLLPWRTVFDNVAMPLRLRKVPTMEIKERVESTLALLDLTEAAKRYPAQLSGGMKRRALLARSIIYRPLMLLMDEPFAALDAQLRTQMHIELLRTVRTENQTVLFITHDIDEAVVLSDRVLVVGGRPGRVTADVQVPFGPNRDVERLRFDQQFVDIEGHVHELLSQARTTLPSRPEEKLA